MSGPRICLRCKKGIEAGQFYTRAYIRNDWQQELTDQGERYASIHIDCPPSPGVVGNQP